VKLLEKQSLIADRAAVAALLASLPADDMLGRLSFEARLSEIDQRLDALGEAGDHTGSVALIFRGGPVIGAHSVDAEFASDALKGFQDIVSKRIAVEEVGELGQRGPLPIRVRGSLGVANMLRGSVGFLLEEQSANGALADTAVKRAIDDVTHIIQQTASEDAAGFDDAVQDLDNRLLVSLRGFFKTLDDARAQVRIVESERESELDSLAIHRARERLESTEIEERDDQVVVGELFGVLPDAKRFEMRLADGQIIRGRVASQGAERYLQLIEEEHGGIVGRWWRTRMKIREVRERNKPPHLHYTLIGLVEVLPEQPR
jgi:hypothetical protein